MLFCPFTSIHIHFSGNMIDPLKKILETLVFLLSISLKCK